MTLLVGPVGADLGCRGGRGQSLRVKEHLTHGILRGAVAVGARSHGVIDQEPLSISRLYWRRTWFYQTIFPWVDGLRERFGIGRPSQKVWRSCVVEETVAEIYVI